MTRGRKPKPTAVKKLEGNPGKRPLNDAEPTPATDMPPMPEDLGEQARACWASLGPEMHRIGILTSIDAGGLESYCRLYGLARECWARAEEQGTIVEIGGKPETNPWLREAHKAESMLHKLRTELGLNATSRSRIAATPADKAEDLYKFLEFDQAAPAPGSAKAA